MQQFIRAHACVFMLAVTLGGISASRPALAAAAAPDAGEAMFWQSTEKIGTPAAYRAYLERYPNGFFAPLARAATSGGVNAPSSAAPAAADPRSPAGGALTPFNETTSSGSVTFAIGEAFEGPAAITVGWLGARKQLVLPRGHWMALAANDTMADAIYGLAPGGSVRVKWTTVVFGRFEGPRLVALLRARFTAEKNKPITWGDGHCDAAGRVHLKAVPTAAASVWRDECLALAATGDPLAAQDPAMQEAVESLRRLGARVEHGTAMLTSIGFGDKQRGALRLSRYDWPAHVLGVDSGVLRAWQPGALEADAGRAAYVERLWAWAQSYREAAREGYLNSIETATVADFEPASAR